MLNPLKNRLVVPAAVLAAVGIGGLMLFGSVAGAANANGAGGSAGSPSNATQPDEGFTGSGSGGVGSGGGVNQGNFNLGTTLPPGIGSPNYLGGPKNTGGANSSVRVYQNVAGKKTLVAYGNKDIIYTKPPASYIPVGEQLFAQNCASCHGTQAEGSAIAPNLQGVGPATVDFWVSTGRMPAVDTNATQAERKPARLTPKQALQVAAYVNSIDPAVPYLPTVRDVEGANLADGASLFALNCAACHTITGAGDALAYGTNAPSLHQATAQQVAEAIRTGPANMPRFTGNLSDAQVRDIVAYVTLKIQHPANPGGAGLGGIGPVAEGFVALLIGVGAFVLICYWIGERS